MGLGVALALATLRPSHRISRKRSISERTCLSCRFLTRRRSTSAMQTHICFQPMCLTLELTEATTCPLSIRFQTRISDQSVSHGPAACSALCQNSIWAEYSSALPFPSAFNAFLLYHVSSLPVTVPGLFIWSFSYTPAFPPTSPFLFLIPSLIRNRHSLPISTLSRLS